MLDYLPEYAREFEERWVDPSDHAHYAAAKRDAERTAILETKWRKARRMVMSVHRKKVELAYRRAAIGSKVRAKYEWLLNYHNEIASEFGQEMQDMVSELGPRTESQIGSRNSIR